MPSATASPCSSRSEKPVSASSAWPKVWPRLSKARLPLVSRSSSATIAALAATLIGDGVVRAPPASPASSAAPFASHQAKKSGVADQAVFDDLGIAGAQLARRQGVEAGGVDQHQRRLVEGADQILAGRRR